MLPAHPHPDALNLFYRAQAEWENRQPTSDSVVLDLTEKAVALDSGFVAAWSLLSQARSWRLRRGVEQDTTAAYLATARTQRLAPGSLEAVTAQGYYRYYAHGDFAGALRELEAADRLLPNSPEILVAISLLQRRLGRWEESIALQKRASQLDPRNASIAAGLGQTFMLTRRFAEAERAIARALALAPNQVGPLATQLEYLGNIGDTAGFRRLYATSGPLFGPSVRAAIDGRLAFFARDYPRALEALAKQGTPMVSTRIGQRSHVPALTAAAAGDTVLARAHADTLLRWARPELARQRARGPSNPFGAEAFLEAQMVGAHALRGERDEARRLAESASRYGLERDAIDAPDLLRMVAISYMLMGRNAEAVALLARLLAVPSTVTVAELRLEPIYDGLRRDEGFRRLVGQ